MSRRQLCNTASSLTSAIRTSSQPSPRFQCIYQQTRGYKYESYEERRQAAKEWAATVGKQYMRPRRGRTNYLKSKRGDKDAFSITKASQGQEGMSEDAAEHESSDPWDDEKAVRQLKHEHDLSEETINEHRTRHQGLTPEILSRALSEKLSDSDITTAIQHAASQAQDSQFDSTEVARNEASKMLAAQQADSARSSREENLHPFPMNRSFQSQAVLSEELREIIYLKVVRDGLTVRTVSTLLGVGMERVGAVVRMKQMERDWVKRVSSSISLLRTIPATCILMMIPFKNRLVFKTTHMVTNKLCEPL
jgi:hypothetical protein